MKPFHNKHINYYNSSEDAQLTPIYWPSKIYYFQNILQKVELGPTADREEMRECVIHIAEIEDKDVARSVLSHCHTISKHQPVASFYACDISSAAELPLMGTNPMSVALCYCEFSSQAIGSFIQRMK